MEPHGNLAMAEIYALFSGRNGLVRYVGETGGAREDRFREHIKDCDSPLRGWFLEDNSKTGLDASIFDFFNSTGQKADLGSTSGVVNRAECVWL
jgi:hypothetical protein